MNILQISSAPSIGGGERHLIDLVSGLQRRAHRIHLAVRPASPLIAELQEFPAEDLHRVPLRNALDLVSARALRGLIREHNIDVVQAHLGRDYSLAAFAVNRTKAKLVLTRHVLFPLGAYTRRTVRRADSVIAVSVAVAAQLRAQKVPANSLHVIHNSVDPARFSTVGRADARVRAMGQLGADDNAFLIGSVGSLVPLKGHADLIHAAALVLERHPQTQFLIIGDEPPGKDQTLSELRALIKKLGLRTSVHLLRGVKDIAVWLRVLDLFVSASHSESFGLAIVEAMASGVPVIATATAGATEVIRDRVTGVLTPVGEVQPLANAIIEQIEDQPRRTRLTTQALVDVRERFGVERMIDETEAVYRSLVG